MKQLELATISLAGDPRLQSPSQCAKAASRRSDCGCSYWHRASQESSFDPALGLTPHRLWLLNVAKEVPATVRLDGFDISLSQAPPQEWLAPNITLRTWDIFEDPPKDIVGQYDIVHVRLVLLVIRENKSIPVIKNLLKLLSKCFYHTIMKYRTNVKL